MTFPLDSPPTGFVTLTGSERGNVYVDGEAPTFTLSAATTCSWTVRDYYGTTIATGTLTGATTLTPTHPGGAWPRGWYRLYLNGPTSDARFGTSLGVTNFAVVAPDNRFTRPALNADPSIGGESPDYALKGYLGLGTNRNTIGLAEDLTATNDTLPGVKVNAAVSNTYWTTGPDRTGPDSARPRVQYASFPNDSVDRAFLGDGDSLMLVHATGASAFVGPVAATTAAGTSSGVKITLTRGATTEVHDNLVPTVSAAITALAGSALATGYRNDDRSADAAINPGQTATLPNARHLGVKQVVEECYPLGVTCYEGPLNEPDIRKNPRRYANDARLFRAAVLAGNASAKTIGPSIVDINPGPGGPETPASTGSTGAGSLYRWLVGAGSAANDGPQVRGVDHIDGLTLHVYNFCNGDLNIGRQVLDNLQRLLIAAGADQLPCFQGEQGVITCVYGVHHPRRARWQMLHHLLLEQYGIPMERNTLWYDQSHGFWSYPGWWINADGSVEPHAVLLRIMAEETYGRPLAARLAFGAWGEHLFVGSRYTSPADGTSSVVVAATSSLANETLTLQLAGTLPTQVTYRAGFGATTTAPVVGGRVTVPITAEPTWIRLPTGVTANPVRGAGIDLAAPNLLAAGAWGAFNSTDGDSRALGGDYRSTYDSTFTGMSVASAPAAYTTVLERTTTISTITVLSGMAWQEHAALLDFDVQTSTDRGATWTTRASVRRTATSILHGSDYRNTGTQRDTYWDEQWVFPVHFDPVSCNAIRINVLTTSQGGEPDADAIASGGQGGAQRVVLTQVMAFCDRSRPQTAVTH